jgi:hypothetical protein
MDTDDIAGTAGQKRYSIRAVRATPLQILLPGGWA